MKPNEIRSALVLLDITGAAIARQAGVTKQFVSSVIRRKQSNARVEEMIAAAIGRPVSEVFPDKEAA